MVTRNSTIEMEKNTIRELIDNIKLQLLAAFPTSSIALGFNFNKRVNLTSTVKFSFVCFAECSIFQIIGFWKQSRINSFITDNKFGNDLMVFIENERLDALLPLFIKRIISMWVYIDIIELSAVGDIQAPFSEYILIQSKFDKMGYWNFTTQYYIIVIEHFVSNITIKICTDTGENFSIIDGKVTCCLQFRRRPFLV